MFPPRLCIVKSWLVGCFFKAQGPKRTYCAIVQLKENLKSANPPSTKHQIVFILLILIKIGSESILLFVCLFVSYGSLRHNPASHKNVLALRTRFYIKSLYCFSFHTYFTLKKLTQIYLLRCQAFRNVSTSNLQ